ncbi:MAG: hypothetical protein HZB46_05350 [Solirubrobacterales bacterium]|nr:hypothetical protein [Solirubrobacterales bacterium]
MRTVLAAAMASAGLAGLPAAADAVEPKGRGGGIEHVRNVPYPDRHAPEERNAGTDLEFATLNIRSDSPLKDVDPATPGKQRRYAFAGSYGDGLQIIDVSQPAKATVVKTWDCGVSQGDVQVFRRADLRKWFVTFTHDDGYDFHADSQCAKDLARLGFDTSKTEGAGTYIADVTNPFSPKTVSFVPVPQGSHNQTVHPSGKYLYNSNSDLITSPLPAIEVIDITDVRRPRHAGEVALKPFPGLGTESHDVTFSQDGRRAYVAALSHGEILDTTDPAHPTSVGTVVDPAINVWHETDTIRIKDPVLGERDFLIAEDEVAGALGTGQCPNGGVHVYDITGDLERTPVKVGAWNIDDVGLTEDGTELDGGGVCTAHVFQLHRKEQLMTIAYYNGGVRVVDLSGLVGVALGERGMGMRQLGWYRFKDSNTWAVKAPFADRKGFYLYGNDHRRGFDVYRWSPGSDAASTSTGTWYAPAQAEALARANAAKGAPQLTAVCLLGRDGARRAAAQAGLALPETRLVAR